GAGGGPVAAAGGGAPAGGDFTHTAPTEALIRTPLALYVEYSGNDVARVIVKYQLSGSNEWKTLKLKKHGDGFGAVIPCTDVRGGTISYFIQGFDAQNQPVAMSGSRTAPFAVEVKADRNELTGDVPSLPGKPPPAQCKDTSLAGEAPECPPGFPGCSKKKEDSDKKDEGQDCERNSECSSGSCAAGKCTEADKKEGGSKCESDDECSSGTCTDGECSDKKGSGEYCEKDNECSSGSCEDSKCVGGGSSAMPRIWIGVAGQLDFYVLKKATDVCLRNPKGAPNAGLNANTAGYTCSDPTTNLQFPYNDADNSSIQPRAGAPDANGGLALGNIRVMATFDYALNAHMLLGARVGYVARTDPAIGVPGKAFMPLHLEARFTYLFGGGLVRGPLSFMVFGAVGASEFDADVPVVAQVTSPNGPTAGSCTKSARNNVNPPAGMVQQQCAENAWVTGGPFFAAPGVGVRFRLGNHFAIPVAAKMELIFGGRAGFMFGLAPELALQYGF
ncbi:MAG: hypothetical protein FWD17_03510, partial [Polyangiaceae bacterium]|nr:hypothetical protein [Polyangiaceae bacterium]